MMVVVDVRSKSVAAVAFAESMPEHWTEAAGKLGEQNGKN